VEHIASFLAPPDLSSFLATSKTLRSSFLAKEDAQARPLAARLVQSALRRQLDSTRKCVISRHEDRPSFTLDDLFPEGERGEDFDEQGRPQVLLSGSCAVQAALGRVFDDPDGKVDIDVFCTWKAVPLMRQRLVERRGLMCGGVDNSGYKSRHNERDDKKLSHVECYADWPTDGENQSTDLPYSSDAYRTQAFAWVAEAIDDVYRNQVGLPGGSSGRVFPYDYELLQHRPEEGCFVQLIIGNEDTADARELFKSFDLTICMCHFDGHKFFVPNPRDTFKGRTAMTPWRRAMVTEFFLNEDFDVRNNGGDSDDEREHYQACVIVARMQKYAGRGVEIVDPPPLALAWEIRWPS
jgi:hypothetical protein